MNITIFGDHTAPYGDFPYEIGNEFEAALCRNLSAITMFSFNSISGADVGIDQRAVSDMTVQQVYARLALAVAEAARIVDWDIWTVETLT